VSAARLRAEEGSGESASGVRCRHVGFKHEGHLPSVASPIPAPPIPQSRLDERRLSYTECHDQSLVGDQALVFRLMGPLMYTHMSLASPRSPVVERGMALHKISRLLTCAAAADAYLNFVGNEFGHPEWIEMPSAANSGSLRLARRRWDLLAHPGLRYAQLARFDREMLALESELGWMQAAPPKREHVRTCQQRQLLYFWRGAGLFIFNLHPSRHAEEQIALPPCHASAISREGTRRAPGSGPWPSASLGVRGPWDGIPQGAGACYRAPAVTWPTGGMGPSCAEPGVGLKMELRMTPNEESELGLNPEVPRVVLNSDEVRLGGGGRAVVVGEEPSGGYGGGQGGTKWLRVVVPPWTAAVVTVGWVSEGNGP
jgi:hypothetical protein